MLPPPDTSDHVTAVLVVPVTDAENCCVAPVLIVGFWGETVTATTLAAVTVTVAVPLFVLSAWLVALTVAVVAALGAV
jgi:hypothetical protein